MEFYDYFTMYQVMKRRFTQQQLNVIVDRVNSDKQLAVRNYIESAWEASGRPYFKLYPSMVKALSNLNLNIKSNQITWPKQLNEVISPFLIKFPVSQPIMVKTETPVTLHSILVFKITKKSVGITSKDRQDLLHILWHTGISNEKVNEGKEHEAVVDIPDTNSFALRLESDQTLESEFIDLFHSVDATVIPLKSCYMNMLRYVIGTILLASDVNTELILPEVLSKHELKFQETGDLALVDKAKRNGKYGWSIGKQLEREVETNTHFRVPHFAIRHNKRRAFDGWVGTLITNEYDLEGTKNLIESKTSDMYIAN